MTKRERELKESGYIYTKTYDTRERAKEHTKALRSFGYRSTFIEVSINGIYHYEIFTKR